MSEVLVWRLVPERATDDEVRAARALLSPDELARADAFVRDLDRRCFALVRAALRRAVAGALGLDPGAAAFSEGPYGKPAVAGADDLHVNVSHTDGLAVLALTRAAPVGVDVERVRDDVNALDLARRYFAPAEADGIAALPQADRALAFLRLWTRKEAVLKASGRGLGGGLAVDVGGDGRDWTTIVSPDLGPFWLIDLDVGPEHVAALAVAPETCAPPLVVFSS